MRLEGEGGKEDKKTRTTWPEPATATGMKGIERQSRCYEVGVSFFFGVCVRDVLK